MAFPDKGVSDYMVNVIWVEGALSGVIRAGTGGGMR